MRGFESLALIHRSPAVNVKPAGYSLECGREYIKTAIPTPDFRIFARLESCVV